MAINNVLGTKFLDHELASTQLAAGEINQTEATAAEYFAERVAFQDKSGLQGESARHFSRSRVR